MIQAAGHERLGLCLDTCHLYVSGVDLRPSLTRAEAAADLIIIVSACAVTS